MEAKVEEAVAGTESSKPSTTSGKSSQSTRWGFSLAHEISNVAFNLCPYHVQNDFRRGWHPQLIINVINFLNDHTFDL
jgi:hypothetical protein